VEALILYDQKRHFLHDPLFLILKNSKQDINEFPTPKRRITEILRPFDR
jgi:hypothetical protein